MTAGRHALTILATTAFLLLAFAGGADAHASKNSADGKVKITWGWQNEPMYAGEKVQLDLIIRDSATNAGIGGIKPEDISELSLHYGEDEFALGNITAFTGVKGSAFAGPGNYTGANKFYLTREGLYVLHIKGTIAGSAVDLEIPAAHETPSLESIAFPAEEEDADDAALEARIAKLESEVATLKANAKTQSETPATITTVSGPTKPAPLGAAVVAVGLVGAALILRRRRA